MIISVTSMSFGKFKTKMAFTKIRKEKAIGRSEFLIITKQKAILFVFASIVKKRATLSSNFLKQLEQIEKLLISKILKRDGY